MPQLLLPGREVRLAEVRESGPLPAYVSGDYPLFGALVGIGHHLKPNKLSEAQRWFLKQRLGGRTLSFHYLWQECSQKCPEFFNEYWLVRLYDQSRDLGPGDYIFQPTINFSRMPSAVPVKVEEAYIRAYLELPRQQFTYLDLVWETLPTGEQKLLTPRILGSSALRQRQKMEQFLADWLWLFQTQRFLSNRMEELMWGTSLMLDLALLPCRPVLRLMVQKRHQFSLSLQYGQRIKNVEVSQSASGTELLASILMSSDYAESKKFVSWDPVIVFEDPDFRPPGFKGIPLGLVAHWD